MEAETNLPKQYRLTLPAYLWHWLAARSQHHDRKPGAEILQILKTEFAKDAENIPDK